MAQWGRATFKFAILLRQLGLSLLQPEPSSQLRHTRKLGECFGNA